MIRLILTVALCAVTAALAVFFTLNPGTMTIQFLGVNAEMPFILGAAALLVLTFLLVVLWWVIAKVWAAPDAFRNFRKRQRREQGFDALERALIASASGQGALAVRQASRAEALLDRPALSRLLAARAAEAAGDLDSARVHYEAMLEDAKTRLVARRGLASIAESRGDDPAALTHARDAFSQAGQARWAYEALFAAQVRQGLWAEAERSLTEGERREHVAKDVAARMRAVLLTAEGRRIEDSEPEAAAKLADKACHASPGFAPAAELAGRLLADQRRHRRAAEVIENAWRHEPHPALAKVYAGLRKSDSKAKRAERLRGLAALNPDHRESRLLLAEVALEQSNLEAARAALTPLLEQPPLSARVCTLAAGMEQLAGDAAAARRHMARAAHAPGEADWSDIDEGGRAFAYTSADWARMVEVWGREARLIHPRHERYEIPAAAAPEAILIEGPKARSGESAAPADAASGSKPDAMSDAKPDSKPHSGADKTEPSYYEPSRAPDDPGVEEDAAKR